MTKYRRHIVTPCKPDKKLPTIFNEYIDLSWDNPNENRTALVAPSVAELGVKYYVIDCGWHDECEYDQLYMNVGKWEASKKRFPNGLKATVNLIKSHGMKAGLWIEPEIIGYQCAEMENYYGEMKVSHPSLSILSMGMTNDYMIAIEECSTMIRIGTGIFGKRDYKNKYIFKILLPSNI